MPTRSSKVFWVSMNPNKSKFVCGGKDGILHVVEYENMNSGLKASVCDRLSAGGHRGGRGKTSAAQNRQEIILVEHSNCGERVLSMCRQSSDAKIHFLRDSKDETTSMKSGDIQGKVLVLRTCKEENVPKAKVPIMMFAAWTCDSRQVVTSQGVEKPASSTDLHFDANAEIRVWCGYSGKLLRVLKRPTDPIHGPELRQAIWNIRTHPVDPRILMSAGEDGRVILWNIETGKTVWCWTNRHPGGQTLIQAKPGQAIALADSCFSSDGTSLAVSDGNGRWSLFATGSKKPYVVFERLYSSAQRENITFIIHLLMSSCVQLYHSLMEYQSSVFTFSRLRHRPTRRSNTGTRLQWMSSTLWMITLLFVTIRNRSRLMRVEVSCLIFYPEHLFVITHSYHT